MTWLTGNQDPGWRKGPARDLESREPFPVTHDLDDAPDGAVIELEGQFGGWWHRSGMTWYPITEAQARQKLAEAEALERWRRCTLGS